MLIIGTLQGVRVFEVDGYGMLITKAALHGQAVEEAASGDGGACGEPFVVAASGGGRR